MIIVMIIITKLAYTKSNREKTWQARTARENGDVCS